jgi:hypothetical protein
MAQGSTAPVFDPKREAQEHRLFIEQYLHIKLDEFRDFRILKAVYRLCQSHQAGERLPRCKKIRADHYRGLIRFMAVAMLYTDLSDNVVVANRKFEGKSFAVPAGNSFFMHKLNVCKSTLDELIKTVKRLGWYISNLRFGYHTSGTEKLFHGRPSIKRVFIGFYDLLGMGKKVRDAIKRAVAFRQRNPKKSETVRLAEMFNGEFDDFGYGKENERRYIKRKAKRELKKLENRAENASSVTNQQDHDAIIAEQLELISKGYTPQEIAAHQRGDKPIIDDIPY